VGAISLDDGSLEKILDVKQPSIYTVTSLTYDPFDKVIYYTTDNSRYRDLRALDPQKGKSRVVKKDLRVGDLAFDRSDRAIWGIRHLNGIVTLVRIPHPYEEWKQVHSWPYGEVVYDIDVSPDGKLLSASIGEIDGRHALHVMRVDDLLAGVVEPIAKVDFGTTIPSNFVFSPDGKFLYGSSYYTGVSNIFRYELETEALELVTNVETGMFRPVPLEDGSVIVFRFTGQGFLPARIDPVPLEDANAVTFLGRQIVEKHPVVTEWIAGSPGSVELDPLVTRDGAYKSLKRVGVESLYPIVEGYKDFPAYGLSLNLSDPIGLNSFRFDGSYTPNSGLEENERVHLDFRYERHNWKARYTLNNADFYDLFGPTKVSRKGSSLGFSHKKHLIFDTPRTMQFTVSATAFADIDTLPSYQNIPTTADKLFVASAHLDYSNRRASLGAVDHEKGYSWKVVLAESFIPDRADDPSGGAAQRAGESFPSLYGDFDIGFALPLKHSSIWLRTSAGASAGDFNDTFANFYFGGFGNNWVDHGTAKRYREFYSFPGIELNSALGRNFTKAMLEWNLPPLRFRRVGSPSFYLTHARFSLFTTALYSNLDGEDIDDVADPLDPMVAIQEKVANVGGQVDFRLKVLARLDLTLSLGYAMAQRECVRVFPGSQRTSSWPRSRSSAEARRRCLSSSPG
jgi:hypothetical protein